jgi:hypothetical protein
MLSKISFAAVQYFQTNAVVCESVEPINRVLGRYRVKEKWNFVVHFYSKVYGDVKMVHENSTA